jgi:restriction system protein
MLAATAHTQHAGQPLTVLLHELLKLWPLWVLVGLVAIGKEALSSKPKPRQRRSRPPRNTVRTSRRARGSSHATPSVRAGGLREIDAMTGTQFEKRLEALFRDLGYAVRHTGRLGDFGADLVVERDGQKTVVQAKRHTNQVGLTAVREVLGAKGYYGCASAIVVTNSTFTWRAKKLAEANSVELWDRSHLVALLDNAKSGGSTEIVAVPNDRHCARCGEPVSVRVRDYCHAHRNRFAGLVYCFEHQRQFPQPS